MRTGDKEPTVAIFGADDRTSACPALRLGLPLQRAEWPIRWGTSLEEGHLTVDPAAAHGADIVVVQRNFPAAATYTSLRKIAALGLPVIYDLDDAIFHIGPGHRQYAHYKGYFPYVRWMLRQADLITVSTQPLAEAISQHTSRPIALQPNIVDFALFDAQPRVRGSRCNLLVSGTPTHRADWEIIEPVLSDLLATRADELKLTFFGDLPEKFRGHPAVEAIGYEPDYARYAEVIRKLDANFSLVPLLDSQFNNSKSNIKWLEYSAAGIPGIYSNVEPYSASITGGEDGLLVQNTPEAWKRAINSLIDNPQRCADLATHARQAVLSRHSLAAGLNKFESVLRSVVGTRHVGDKQADLRLAPYRIRTATRRIIKEQVTRHLCRDK